MLFVGSIGEYEGCGLRSRGYVRWRILRARSGNLRLVSFVSLFSCSCSFACAAHPSTTRRSSLVLYAAAIPDNVPSLVISVGLPLYMDSGILVYGHESGSGRNILQFTLAVVSPSTCRASSYLESRECQESIEVASGMHPGCLVEEADKRFHDHIGSFVNRQRRDGGTS